MDTQNTGQRPSAPAEVRAGMADTAMSDKERIAHARATVATILYAMSEPVQEYPLTVIHSVWRKLERGRR